MSDTKFTPGPWRSLPDCDIPAGERRMADDMFDWLEKNRAKARLIRAAPDLHRELAHSVRLMCNNCNRCELDANGKPMFEAQACATYTRKVAVLKKARGEA